MTPLCFANPSPPSGWIGDFHPQAIEHAGHTTKPLSRSLVATRGVARSRRPVLRLRGLEPHPRQEPPMTDKAISPLRRRLIEDMTIRRLGPGTQHQYIRHVKSFADFIGCSPDKATPEDVRRYQLRLASIGTTVPTLNAGASALQFFSGSR